MSRTRSAFAAALVPACAIVHVAPAAAQAVDNESLIARTCLEASAEQPVVARRRLAAFILADAGIIADDPEARLRQIVADGGGVSAEVQGQVRRTTYQLQQELAERLARGSSEPGLDVRREDVGGGWWLIDHPVVLTCRFDEEEIDAAQPRARSIFETLRLRQDSEALTATGPDRLKAGAAQIAYQRERVTVEDGSRRTDSTWSIEGALGVPVADSLRASLLLFAAYELNRVRSDPAPQLEPGQAQSDKDTNVLEVGFTGHRLISSPAVSIMLSGSGSVIFDRADRSDRLRLRLSASPAFGRFPGGLCYLGGYGPAFDLGFGAMRGRCTLTFLGQVNHVLDPGSADPTADDEFVLAGGRAGLEFATGDDSGVIAGASYEYQHRLSGDVPSIDRFVAHLKYRHWLPRRRVGIEFGFDFADGINPDSFVDEHRVRLGFGLIF